MLAILAAIVLKPDAKPEFAPAQLWALNFAAPPRIPLLGDADADGDADLICIYPQGKAIIDVALSQEGRKSGVPFQALNPWSENCEAAIVGEFDAQKGADVMGLFDGRVLRLAGKFQEGKFRVDTEWLRLPEKLEDASLALLDEGAALLAWNKKTGRGYRIQLPEVIVRPARVAPGFIARTVWKPNRLAKSLPRSNLPKSDSIHWEGDVDGDGDLDVVEFRYGTERHTQYAVYLYRRVGPQESDNDGDGLDHDAEVLAGSDPLLPDSDGDGLLDSWEVNGFRGLDLPKMGCSPKRADVVCLVSRFSNLKPEDAEKELARAKKFYADAPVLNPDKSTGISLHIVMLDPVSEQDMKRPWWELRDKFRPLRWKGVAHWMQLTPWGGGQADQLGDGGGAGGWAAFCHELGHQLGLDHTGYWSPAWSPIYPSLMNYAYSYSFEDSPDRIQFSDGTFANLSLKETELNESLPIPYEKARFLEKSPYRFRLKPNGKSTVIDWNWNGVFGERRVKADINYSYSTNAGRRDEVGKTNAAPWVFTHQNYAYLLCVTAADVSMEPKADPTVSASNPGQLSLRKLNKPFSWENAIPLAHAVTGDPSAMSDGKQIVVLYPTALGVHSKRIRFDKGAPVVSDSVLVSAASSSPTVFHDGKQLRLLQRAESGTRILTGSWNGEHWSPIVELPIPTLIPPGAAYDSIRNQILLGVAQDQDDKRRFRWKLLRLNATTLAVESEEWVGGEQGSAAGMGRCTLLFDKEQRWNGPSGRVYWFAQGTWSKEAPWSCTFVAHTVADRSVSGGWQVKRMYDEWTQSRSAPAATWFDGDILWGYRWVDGAKGTTDNNLHIGYRATGIETEPMGDHNDIAFLRDFGIRASILYLGADQP